MPVHSLGTVTLVNPSPEKPRHANLPKGQKRPETRVLECPRVKVSEIASIVKQRHIERLEQNQLISSCCRHPENHEIAAFKSHPDEKAPDIYEFYCTCGRTHRFFCVGAEDEGRPVWKAA